MIQKIVSNKCSGCSSCASACPTGCIKMSVSNEGFLYPNVDERDCIKCGICVASCPLTVSQSISENASTEESKIIAAYSKDDKIRSESSSGAIFPLLAREILREDGVVFGAAFDENFSVHHTYIETEEDLQRLTKSKYVQSNTEGCFEKAKEFLESGRKVLFTGTSCQTSGLLTFLKKDYEGLYTADIVCHGVPSPLVWEKYKEHLEQKFGSRLKNVNFRNKKYGWHGYFVSFTFENEKTINQKAEKDPYMFAFLRDYCLRESCHSCSFKHPKKCADITLGDFWGIKNFNPSMDDNKGTSLVFINTKKGDTLFEKIKSDIVFIEDEELIPTVGNPFITTSPKANPKRNEFLDTLSKRGFSYAKRKYLKIKLSAKLKNGIKAVIRRIHPPQY